MGPALSAPEIIRCEVTKRLITAIYAFVLQPFLLLWRYRALLTYSTLSDIKIKFAGSLLGSGWLFIHPLVLLLAYGTVFLLIFNVRSPGLTNVEYVGLLFCGLVPFLGFAEALSSGIVALTSQATFIKNSLFPIEMIPVKAVLAAQAKQLIGAFILLIGLAALGNWHVTALLIIPLWMLQLLFMIGLGWLLSPINTYVRDLSNVAGLATSFLMIVSPIAYTPEMVPETLKSVLLLNPLYYLIVPWQEAVIRGVVPELGILTGLTAMSLATFLGGFLFFVRLRSVVVDHV